MIKALIVERDDDFRLTLRKILGSQYHTLTFDEVKDGKKALEIIGESRPDLVFMDIKLPGEKGFELTKKIRTLAPEIVIVILTSLDQLEYQQAAYESGANHFMSKHTSTAKEIIELVGSILSKLETTENCHST